MRTVRDSAGRAVPLVTAVLVGGPADGERLVGRWPLPGTVERPAGGGAVATYRLDTTGLPWQEPVYNWEG
jgi:hypothetical protein